MLIDKSKTDRIIIPHEVDQWVDLVALTGAEMDVAREAATQATLAKFKPYIKEFSDIQRAKGDQEADESYTAYDAAELLKMAIKDWSAPVEVSPANIEKLDGATRDFLWRTIWERNTARPLVKEMN